MDSLSASLSPASSGNNSIEQNRTIMNAGSLPLSQALALVDLLLVDDEPVFGQKLQQRLHCLGLRVWLADSCRSALDLLEQHDIAVVIMDMQMPEVDGIQCLRRIKREWPEVEVLFLTGHASVETGIEGMEGGAFDYCLKPIDVPDLLEKVELAAQKALINREKSGSPA